MIYIRERERRNGAFFFIKGGFFLGAEHVLDFRGKKEERTSKKRIFIWELSSEGRGKIARSRAIATKAVQVCTSLLSEFLPIFDFFREFDS